MNPPRYRVAVAHPLHDACDPGTVRLVDRWQLDLLQLDYQWPTSGLLDSPATASPSTGHARGLLPLVTELQRLFYLTSEFRLITNAGAGQPQRLAETIGNCLCEHGNASLPVTAIRGADILAQLEELTAAGADFSNLRTGASLETLRQPIRLAQVEVGADPIATALAEGTRLVIAGSYCPSAPLLAASRRHFSWTGNDFDTLARVQVASQLAHWGPVELDADGSCRLLVSDAPSFGTRSPGAGSSASGQQALQTLRDFSSAFERQLSVSTSRDVAIDLSRLQIESTPSGDIRVFGVQGRAARDPDHWPVTLWYQSHYTVRVHLETPRSHIDRLIGALLERFGGSSGASESGGLSLERILPLDLSTARADEVAVAGDSKADRWLVTWRSADRASCERWNRQWTTWLGCQPDAQTRLLEPWPEIRWHWAPWRARVPRELITLSIDTRLAEDWSG